jgi:hypothetical protein
MNAKLITAFAGAALAACVFATGAQAVLPVTVAPCAGTDITPNAQACLGFYGGQYLSGNAGDVAVQKEALGLLGFVWDGTTVVEEFSGLSGSDPTFLTSLNGVSWLAIHWGGGADSPLPNGGSSTSFYRFDAGTDLHTVVLNYGSSSDAKLYFTGNENPGGGPVPEPATWAMMLVGFGGMGAVLRRNRRQAQLAFA